MLIREDDLLYKLQKQIRLHREPVYLLTVGSGNREYEFASEYGVYQVKANVFKGALKHVRFLNGYNKEIQKRRIKLGYETDSLDKQLEFTV